MLNDGETKLEATFSERLHAKLAGGAVKPHAVLKLTDVAYRTEDGGAVIADFEVVKDDLTEEFIKAGDDDFKTPAAKKQRVVDPTGAGAAAATASVPTSTSSSAKKTQSIASLNPYMGNWTVKAKLASKGNIRTFRNARGEGRVCTIELVDEAGTAIQATMWKDAIDRYDALLEVGKVYYVSRGTLRPANRQYSSVNNDYEMSLDGRCEIEVCDEVGLDMSKMARAYELCKIDALPRKINSRGSVDVLAVVTQVGELGAVRRKSDNTEIQRRDVTLLDETKRTVSLTLWNSLAVEQGEQLATMNAPIVAVRGLRVTDYNGVSLSTVARSELFVEPVDVKEVAEKVAALRAWYDAEGATAETVAAGAGLATARNGAGGNGAGGALERTTLAAMQPEELAPAMAKPEMGLVCATSVLIKTDQPMYYTACPEEGNNKKVVEENGRWYCEATGKTYDTCRRRYILRLKVADASGGAWVNVFHEQAVEMLGVDAEELHQIREKDQAAYERRVKAAQFSQWSLKIRSKTEEYQGESRRRLTVAACAPPDYAAEAKNLLALIQGK